MKNLKKKLNKIEENIIKVRARKCPNCKDIIYSRANYDFRSCNCGEISVDGGFSSYGGRVLWKNQVPEYVELEVKSTIEELYEDWNSHIDKFGLVKCSDYTEGQI